VVSNSCGASGKLFEDDDVPLVVQLERPNGVRLVGELDVASVDLVWARLSAWHGDLELDCAGLTFVDAAGLRLFVALRSECQARGSKLSIVRPSRCVVRLLALTGLDAVLDVQPESWAR
jgi:anti-anti-sigma factor